MTNTYINTRKKVERKLREYDIYSVINLIEHYRVSNVEEQQQIYLKQALDILEKSAFSLLSMKLSNVKVLSEITIDFHDQLTVIVGQNGVGKTTICDSIAIFLGWMTARIHKESANGRRVLENDISIQATSSEIYGKIKLDDNNILDYKLVDHKSASDKKYTSEFDKLNNITAILREGIDEQINLPIFIYYSVERAYNNKGTLTIDKEYRTQAYRGSLEKEIKTNNIVEWLIAKDNQQFHEEYNLLPEFEEMDAQIKSLEELSFEDAMSQGDPLNDIKIALKKLSQLTQQGANLMHNKKALDKIFSLFDNTINHFIADLKDMRIERSTGEAELVFSYYGHSVGIEQLSHGQKSIIYMLLDLVYRASILNPNLKDPRECKGIVVIDEIELHLHPDWQQKIIAVLCEIFPNIQFIITTHSPMVLQTVPKESLRILENNNGKIDIITSELQTQGISTDEILLYFLDIPSTPDTKIFRDTLRAYDLIEMNNPDNDQELDMIIESLELHFGSDSSVLQKLRAKKSLKDLKKKIADRKNEILKS